MERRGSVRFQQLTLMLPTGEEKKLEPELKSRLTLRPQAEKRARFNLGVSFREKFTDGA
jgi:hypothetical protein